MKQMFDWEQLDRLVEKGTQYVLDEEEEAAVGGHKMGSQLHLLTENYFTRKSGVVLTKIINDDLDIAEFVRGVIDACNFKCRVFCG